MNQLDLCTSPRMRAVRELIAKVASTNATVLLTGESGVGKEVVARAIHRESPRSGNQFLKVNCAALPEELLESELFGHQRGAFTGAYRDKPGKFELAAKGTRDDLFPDPALAGQQHSRVGRGDLRDQITDGEHLWAVAEFQLIHQSRPLSTSNVGYRRRMVQGSSHM